MRLRLMGLPDEVQAVAAALHTCPGLLVVSVSAPYPNRGDSALVRVYVEVRATRQRHPVGRELPARG